MKKHKVEEQLLFPIPVAIKVRRHQKPKKKKRTKKALKQARRRWRITYKLRKRGITIKTRSKQILLKQKPADNPVKSWVEELISNFGYHVQFTI